MSIPFDLHLLPIHRFAGQDQAGLPGLYQASPPRRTARGRQADHLLLYLALTGNAPLSAGKGEQILEQLAATYYKTPGSVTAGLRAVVDSLNEFLLDRNVRSASTGRQAIGLMTLVLLRENRLYLSQSGPVHAFVINGEGAQHLFDPQLSGRGLGLSRSAPIRYYQTVLQPNDLLLLAARPSPTWNAAALTGAAGQEAEQVHRRLTNRQDLELNAVLIQARPASGRRQAAGRSAPAAETPAGEAAPAPEAPTALAPAASAPSAGRPAASDLPERLPVVPVEMQPGPVSLANSPPEPVDQGAPGHALEAGAEPAFSEPGQASEAGPPGPLEPDILLPDQAPDEDEPAVVGLELPPVEAVNPRQKQPVADGSRRNPAARRGAAVGDLLESFGKFIVTAWLGGLRGLRRGLARVLPGEGLLTIPASTMIAIAVIVPVVVVAIASKVYIDRGLMSKYQSALEKAQWAAEQAPLHADPIMQRQIWEAGLLVLAEAESYQPASPEVRTLRTQALAALDALDQVTRMRYRPAIIGGLPAGVNISRLVQSDDDLYMLDSNSGRVLRGRVTPNLDYEMDDAFQCGPQYGIGRLIDIVPVPLGSRSGAVVIGLDAAGNSVSCFTGAPPIARQLSVPVTAPNWGSLQGFSYDLDGVNLYVLDPADQAVWIYWGGNLDKAPEFFFGDSVPPMTEVIDLAVDKRDLYLLHKDGSLKLCVYSLLTDAPTRCPELPYTDTRRGLEGQALTPPTSFSQVYASSPPDPSLYLLEPGSQSIYRFSLRTVTFYREFKPAEDLAGGPATAFTINVLQRLVFLATGNRVYQAAMP